MKPFSKLVENETITKADLLNSGFVKEDVEISDDEVNKLATNGKMCMMLVNTLSEIDEETLTQIETLAHSLQVGLQDELEKLPDDQKTDADPSDVINSIFSNLQQTVEKGDGLDTVLDSNSPDALGGILNKILPNVMSAINQKGQSESEDEKKLKILRMYEQIDGNTKRR